MNARASMLAGLSCLALASSPAVAQDAPENSYDGNEIIVTATKRDASLQDVPFSINAQTERRGDDNLVAIIAVFGRVLRHCRAACER